MKLKIPLSIIILGILVLVLHRLALEHSYYFVYFWFDIMMHFLGGMFASLFGYYLFTKLSGGVLPRENRYLLLIDVILFVFIVGLLWETFELAFELTINNRVLYLKDTAIDFIMNTIGALVGFFYFMKIITIKKVKKENGNA